MMYLVVTLVTLLLAFALMATGLILRNKPIKGTCASLSTIGMKENCEICGGDQNKCTSSLPDETTQADALSRDAGRAQQR